MFKAKALKGNLSDIMALAPMIVETAKKLFEKIKVLFDPQSRADQGKREMALGDLDKRVGQLEANEIQQAELIQDMAYQVENLSTAVQTISKRLLLIAIFAIVSFLGFLIIAIKMWIID
jgi:hypothetical protein